MRITTQDIKELVLIGRTGGQLDDLLLNYFKLKDYINRENGSTWRELVANLSDLDLISVFKALVCIEKELNWIGGSVAGAIWVYNVIQNRGLDRDLKIADFGLRNCDNPWVPFGCSYYGVRTIEDYYKYITLKENESKAKADHYEKILNRVVGRKEIRVAAIAELRKLSNEERGMYRKELLEQYKDASTYEKLKLIAEDKKYPPEYYPPEWISISYSDIERLPKGLIKQLYDKLSTKTKGEWKRFAQKLESLDDGI
jgi:hypothetical protein